MPLTSKQNKFIRARREELTVAQMAAHIKAKPAEVATFIESLPARLSPSRKRLFMLLTFAIPFVCFLLLELGLRVFNYGGNLDLFISAGGDYKGYYRCNPAVARRYFFLQKTIPDPSNDLFLKEKPANGYRIFVVGGSTTAGYPYANNVMFSRILNQRLADAYPDRHVEVINTAITAVNTHTILDFLDEIIQKQADAILVYSGHNEFYGALGVASNESLGRIRSIVQFYLKLQRFKTFILIRNMTSVLKNSFTQLFSEGSVSDPSATLMERMVAAQTIPLGSPLYETGKNQFEGNIRELVGRALEADIKIVLSELVSNTRGLRPFVSVKAGSLPPAATVFDQARSLESSGDYESARAAYVKAKDLDGLRFRATEEFNDILSKIGSELSVPVVPMKQYFERASPNGIVGNELMLEHLHPNIDGYFLMADAFFNTICDEQLLGASCDSSKIKPASFYRDTWGFTELDEAYSDLRIKILKGGWPFVPKGSPNRSMTGYRPTSKIDSLAWKAWSDKSYGMEHAHVDLGEFYANKRDFMSAFEEYKALTKLTPVNSSPYLRAADMLIKSRALKEAIYYLEKSLPLEDTAYANKWLGQIHLELGETAKALSYLKKAAKQAANDAQLIYNLSGAYALSHKYEEAKRTLAKLDSLSPNFPGAADLSRQLEKN